MAAVTYKAIKRRIGSKVRCDACGEVTHCTPCWIVRGTKTRDTANVCAKCVAATRKAFIDSILGSK